MDGMPVQQEARASFTEFATHMRAGRARALGAFLAVVLPGLLVAALLRPSFRATATLAVLPAPEFTVRNAAGSHDPNTSTLAMDQIMKAESAILDSDDLHAATLRGVGEAAVYPDLFGPEKPNLALRLARGALLALLSPWRVTPSDPDAALRQRALRAFESDLTVLPTKDANVITVSFDNPDGRQAAATVNTLLALYAAKRSQLYKDPQVDIVRKTVAASAAAAAAADRRLGAYKQANGISDYTQQRDLLLHRLTLAQQGQAEAEATGREQQARVEALARILRAEPASVPIYHEHDPDTRLQAVNAGLQDLRSKLAAAREKYLDGSRTVTMLTAEIGAQEREAARLGHDPEASVVRQGRNPNLEALRLDRAHAATELAAAEARRAAGAREAQAAQAALEQLDRAETGLLALQRQRDAANDDFRTASRILAERHLSESEDALRLANVRVIQPAQAPQKPRPIPILVIAASVVFGCIAAFGRIVAGFVMHPVFLTGEGLEFATGIPVLAVFGKGPAAAAEGEMELQS
jgi:uncharacterized protein involved in exopolysaccharide biosynthesis